MANEKILIVKFESTLPAHVAKQWEALGWEVKYEMCPAIPLDFTDNISHDDMARFMKEIGA